MNIEDLHIGTKSKDASILSLADKEDHLGKNFNVLFINQTDVEGHVVFGESSRRSKKVCHNPSCKREGDDFIFNGKKCKFAHDGKKLIYI